MRSDTDGSDALMDINATETDSLDPAHIDWPTADDATVYYAAQAGVVEAQAELLRREHLS